MRDRKPISIERDDERDIVTIEGMHYAGEFFRAFAADMPLDQPFAIIKREDGVITISKLPAVAGNIARDGPAPWKGGSNYRAEIAPTLPTSVLLLLKGYTNREPDAIRWYFANHFRVKDKTHEGGWEIETDDGGILAYDNPMIVAWAPLPEVEA